MAKDRQIEMLIDRISNMNKKYSPQSPQIRAALTRIGTVLASEMVYHAKNQDIKDTGTLIRGINYKIEQSGNTAFVTVGPFGVKYAARNEFGGAMSRREVGRMFSELRKRSGYSKVPRPSKGIVTVNPDGTGYWYPRPFVFRALKEKQTFILRVIRELGNVSK